MRPRTVTIALVATLVSLATAAPAYAGGLMRLLSGN